MAQCCQAHGEPAIMLCSPLAFRPLTSLLADLHQFLLSMQQSQPAVDLAVSFQKVVWDIRGSVAT
eukprot:4477121-Alexandrium_andersonii.AAC.1